MRFQRASATEWRKILGKSFAAPRLDCSSIRRSRPCGRGYDLSALRAWGTSARILLCLDHRSQRFDELVNLLLSNDEWRKHPQYRLVRAVDDETFLQHLLHDFFTGNRQLDGQHESLSADFLDDRQIL